MYCMDRLGTCKTHYSVVNLLNDKVWMLKTIPIKLFAPTANPIETFVIPEFSENDKPRFPRRHKPSFLRWFL